MSDFETPAVSLTDDLAAERVVDLSDFAETPGGPLPRGWYTAEIVDGYATRSGKQFETSDAPSKEGDSRNIRLCFKVAKADGETRNLQDSLNYRITDFTPERLEVVKQARVDFKGVKGRWSNPDIQRSSLAVASLGQLGKAIGTGIPLTEAGTVRAGAFVGKTVDIRLSIDDGGYNSVTGYAPAGAFTAKPKKQ